MKKVMYTNISGIVFNIDDDAFAALKAYLDALNNHFGKSPEGTEIVADIESRIAELFHSRSGDPNRVVNIYDVNHVIEVLGTPEAITDAPEEDAATKNYRSETEKSSQKGKRPKRMYRDPYNAKIAGVCSGMATYFNVDPVLIRVIFVAVFLVYGASLWAYAILWIVLPKAITTGQRLEMYGENVNINTIEKKVREEMESESQNSREYGRVTYGGKPEKPIFLKLLTILFGIFLLIVSLPMLIAFLAVTAIIPVAFSTIPWNHMMDPDLMYSIQSLGGLTVFAKVVLCILAVTPLIALILLSIRLIFNAQFLNRWVFIPIFVLWIGATITLAVLGMTSRITINKQWDVTYNQPMVTNPASNPAIAYEP